MRRLGKGFHVGGTLIVLLLYGCASRENAKLSSTEEVQCSKNEYQMGAVNWFQHAAEVRALQYMAFNVARQRLDEDLKGKKFLKGKLRPAVVVDIDETILDNSGYQAQNILKGKNFSPEGWQEWVDKEKAVPIPGALEFLQYAHNQGVRIFYITNRKLSEEKATLNNLLKLGFPVKAKDLLVRVDKSGKEARREQVAKDHRIVLLIGDNLNDLSDIFEAKNVADRFAETDRWKEEFGKRWIVLPNPMYGDWEGALYDYNWKKTDEERGQDRWKSLRNFGY